MKVKCIKENLYYGKLKSNFDITSGATYTVLGIEDDYYRLIGDKGWPYLYPIELFSKPANKIQPNWLISVNKDNILLAYPSIFSSEDFFQNLFNGHEREVTVFNKHIRTRLFEVRKRSSLYIVRCVKQCEGCGKYGSINCMHPLSVGRIYSVFNNTKDSYEVIDELGFPVFFPSTFFSPLVKHGNI